MNLKFSSQIVQFLFVYVYVLFSIPHLKYHFNRNFTPMKSRISFNTFQTMLNGNNTERGEKYAGAIVFFKSSTAFI